MEDKQIDAYDFANSKPNIAARKKRKNKKNKSKFITYAEAEEDEETSIIMISTTKEEKGVAPSPNFTSVLNSFHKQHTKYSKKSNKSKNIQDDSRDSAHSSFGYDSAYSRLRTESAFELPEQPNCWQKIENWWWLHELDIFEAQA